MSAGFKRMMMMVFVAVLLAVMMDTVICADDVEAKGVLASGDVAIAIVDSANSTISPISSTVTQNNTAAPVVTSTAEKDDEKPITETIRTYIEEGVSSVKHAISKIGKFVGELFEDTPTNTTIPTTTTTPSVNKTTVIPAASTVIPSAAPSLAEADVDKN